MSVSHDLKAGGMFDRLMVIAFAIAVFPHWVISFLVAQTL